MRIAVTAINYLTTTARSTQLDFWRTLPKPHCAFSRQFPLSTFFYYSFANIRHPSSRKGYCLWSRFNSVNSAWGHTSTKSSKAFSAVSLGFEWYPRCSTQPSRNPFDFCSWVFSNAILTTPFQLIPLLCTWIQTPTPPAHSLHVKKKRGVHIHYPGERNSEKSGEREMSLFLPNLK